MATPALGEYLLGVQKNSLDASRAKPHPNKHVKIHVAICTSSKGSISYIILFFFLIFFSTFIYFWDRERQSMNGGGAEREGDTELETGSRL